MVIVDFLQTGPRERALIGVRIDAEEMRRQRINNNNTTKAPSSARNQGAATGRTVA
jgi:hypothetical protein